MAFDLVFDQPSSHMVKVEIVGFDQSRIFREDDVLAGDLVMGIAEADVDALRPREG